MKRCAVEALLRALTHVDQPRIRCHRENPRIDQSIVQHDIGLLQQPGGFQRQKVRVARSGADKVNARTDGF